MRTEVKSAAIYTRISADQEGEGKGVARQERDCRDLAERLGWGVAGTYSDNDISAFSGRRRPEYERLMSDINAGTVDAVLAWAPDRLHRRPVELEAFIDAVERADAPVQTVVGGVLDLSTSDGRMHARVTGAFARHESERKSERARRKHLELAEAGKVGGGGTRPFGFESDRRTIRADEANRIHEAAAHVLAGGSLWGVCTRWNDEGVRTVTGARWRPQILRRILTSGRIAGWREHRGDLVAEAEWPAIIDRDDLDRLRALLLDPSRRTNGRPSRYLLTGGVARCGRCGEPLIARGRGGGTRGYTCATQYGGCGRIRVAADDFEAHVTDRLLEVLAGPELWQAMTAAEGDRGTDDRDALDAIASDEAKLEELSSDYYVDGAITKAAFLAAQKKLTARIEANKSKLAASAATPLRALKGDTADIASRWEDIDIDTRRAIVAAVVEKVEVGPAVRGRNTFDPDRVTVTWRY